MEHKSLRIIIVMLLLISFGALYYGSNAFERVREEPVSVKIYNPEKTNSKNINNNNCPPSSQKNCTQDVIKNPSSKKPTIEKQKPTTLIDLAKPIEKPACKVGGCSREICSDTQQVSSCIYSPVYACYQSALCERQATGECGWTQSTELTQCIDQANSNNTEPIY